MLSGSAGLVRCQAPAWPFTMAREGREAAKQRAEGLPDPKQNRISKSKFCNCAKKLQSDPV